MANEKFKVKFGLAVGDTAATIDATTGDIVTNGDIQLGGNDIKSSGGSTAITLSSTDVNVAGDLTVTGNDIKSSSATAISMSGADVTVKGDLTVDGGDIRSQGGTVAISITGADATVQGNATVNGILYTDDVTNSAGPISITSGANGNITLTPNGTGDVVLSADTVIVGDSASPATITTNGNALLTVSSQGANNVIIDPGSGTAAVDGNLILGQSNTATVLTTNGTGNLDIRTGSYPTSANIQLADGANGNITVDTDGTGQVIVNANVDINGTIFLDELQVDNININGNTISSTDTNGNITLDPNGTGDVALTLANGGNLTNTRNYVFGAIRNATTDSNGDIWTLDADSGGAGTFPSRGISVDNSADTTRTAVNLIRNYSAVASNSPRLVFERSRGTAASPTTLSSGDLLGLVGGTGYSSTLGWINDTLPVMPATMSFSTSEAWSNNTNLGTQLNIQLAPTATTITTVANLITTIAHNPQTAVYRSDAFTFRQGKTGTTDLLTLGTGTSALKSDNIILETSAGTDMLTLTTASSALRSDSITLETSAGTDILALGTNSSTFSSNQINIFGSGVTAQPYKSSIMPSTGTDNGQINLQTASTDGSKKSSFNFGSYRFNGTDLSATQSGDVLGEYKFNGNTATSGSNPTVPGAPGANIVAAATENWTGSANGTKFTFSAIKTGTLTSVSVIDASPSQITLKSDAITLQDSTGTALTSAAVNYTRTYGEFAYTNAAGFAIPAQNTIYVMPLDTTLNNSNVTISGTGSVNINTSGWYKIIISLQITLTVSNQPGQIDFWLRKNGVDVTNSKTQVDLLKDQKSVISMDWLVNSDGNDYWEIVYVGTTANYADIDFPTIAATTTPYVSPLAPALIVNVIPAGM
jgi:hypothetical protein